MQTQNVEEIAQIAFPIVAQFEGLRLEAYPDAGYGWARATVGYGATGPGIVQGTVWTKEEADADLTARLAELAHHICVLVQPDLSSKSAAACVSLSYNIGIGAFEKSSILKLVNEGNMQEAAEHFLAWNKANGKVLEALVKRRAEERQVFLDGLQAA